MNVLRVRRVVPLLAAVSLLAYGCASPPEAEQKAAQSAVSAARAAGADKYARSEYGAMDSALKAAESEMGAKKYKEAKEGYEKAKGLAETAAKAAEDGKAAMKAEVEKQVGDLEKRWKAFREKADINRTAGELGGSVKQLGSDLKAAYERIAALEARLAEATELCDDMFTSIENLAQIANLSGAVEEILTQFGYPLNHNLAHFAERRAALPPESAEG